MSRQLVSETVVGYRLVGGTDWPVKTQLHREEHYGVRWIVTRDLCNGVPLVAEEFRRRKDAVAEYKRVGGML